jgi:Uncharacterized protein conserved in bacteria
MTDQFDDEFTREQQAFRDSFAGVDEFAPLDPAQFTTPAAPRLLWARVIGAAAAAVVVVAGAGFGLTQLAGRGLPVTAAGAAASAEVTTAANDKDSSGGGVGLPAPEAPTASSEYSLASSWQQPAPPPLVRFSPATGWLEGRFYLIGGTGPCSDLAACKTYRDGAAYDPSTDSWTQVAASPVSLQDQSGVAFQGKLYFTSTTDVMKSTLVVYDPSTNSWATIAAPARLGGLVVAGDQLIGVGLGTRLGGDAVDRRYDPASNTWTALPTDPFSPDQTRSVVAVGNRLVLSAYTLSGETKYATFDLTTQNWEDHGTLTASGNPVAVGHSVVWLTTGSGNSGNISGVYDVDNDSWQMYAIDLQPGSLKDSGTVVGDRITYYGHLLNPPTAGLTALPELPKAKLTGQVVIGSPNGLLVYRVTGVDDKAKATAYYLPVSP